MPALWWRLFELALGKDSCEALSARKKQSTGPTVWPTKLSEAVMIVDENTPHARDCPAGENILDLHGKSCDCGLEQLRESQRKQREGYRRWLAEKRAKSAGRGAGAKTRLTNRGFMSAISSISERPLPEARTK
jgi:hypothetical protein